MISESWFAIDSDDSPLRNREITTVMLGLKLQAVSRMFLYPFRSRYDVIIRAE